MEPAYNILRNVCGALSPSIADEAYRKVRVKNLDLDGQAGAPAKLLDKALDIGSLTVSVIDDDTETFIEVVSNDVLPQEVDVLLVRSRPARVIDHGPKVVTIDTLGLALAAPHLLPRPGGLPGAGDSPADGQSLIHAASLYERPAKVKPGRSTYPSPSPRSG